MLKLILSIVILAAPKASLVQSIRDGLEGHGYRAVVSKPALGFVATKLASMLASTPERRDTALVAAQLKRILVDAGFNDATYWVSIVRAPRISADHILTDMLPKVSRRFPPHLFGFGMHETSSEQIAVTLLVHRAGELEVRQSDRAADHEVVFHGRVERGYFQPKVVVEKATGQTATFTPKFNSDRSFTLNVMGARVRDFTKVELVADHAHGPRVLNLLDLSVQHENTLPVVRLERPRELTPSENLRSRVERWRGENELATLVLHPKLLEDAQARARELSKSRDLIHKSHQHGHLKQRLASANLYPAAMAELLVHANSPMLAFEALKSSPAHFSQLKRPEWSHIGIGHYRGYYVLILSRFAPVEGEGD